MCRLAVLLDAPLLLSCASSIGAASNASSPPPASDVTLMSQPYTLHPGDEKFYCYTMTL
jgi:hypothetical protein